MTAASERQSRKQKRKRQQHRRATPPARRSIGALSKLPPLWQTVIGISVFCLAAVSLLVIVYGIFFA